MTIPRSKTVSQNAPFSNWLAVGVIALLLPAAALGQALVPGQKASNSPIPTTANSVTVSFPSQETTGDINVVVVGWSDSVSTVKSVTDTANSTYILAAGTNSGKSVSQAIYYAVVKSEPASNTVTVTFNQNSAYPDVRIFEYSGVDTTNPVEVASGQSGNTSGVANSGTGATISTTDLLIGAGTTTGGFSNTLPPPAPPNPSFTVELVTPGADIDMDAVTTSANTYNATANVSAPWVMQIVAFRGAGQAAPAPSSPTVTNINPASGGDAGYDMVTITGTDFRAGATVTFGGVSGINCAITAPSPSTTITCSSPPSPTNATVPVVVANPDGNSASSPTQFTYNMSAPTITNVTPATTNGGKVTITGTNFVGPVAISVDGIPATGVNVSSSTSITATVPAHAVGSGLLAETNADGGSATAPLTYAVGTGAINFVQSNSAVPQTPQTTVSVPYLNSQGVGDLNVIVIGWSDTTSSVVSVTDSNHNSYTQALHTQKGNGVSQVIYYAANVKGGANSVSVAFSGAAAFPDVRVLEYSGLDTASPLDNAALNAGSGTPASSGPVATHSAVEVIIAAGTVTTQMTGPGPNANSFTLIDITTPNGDLDEHLITSSAGTYTPQADVKGSGGWVMQAVAFKAPNNAAAPNFALSASPTSNSVNPGSAATYTLSVSGQNGFSSTVNLSCSGPANVGISCSLNPSSVTPGSTPASAMLTVTTTGPTAALMVPHRMNLGPLFALWLPLPAIALATVGFGSQRRKLLLGLVGMAFLTFCLLLSGCGGGGSSNSGGGGSGGNGGTVAGSYNITVAATSGNLSHSMQVTLAVQ